MGYRRMRYDGGTVEYTLAGPADAPGLLVFHNGTPTAAVDYPALAAAAGRAGLKTVSYSRAGYGGSTRRPGRRVADEAPITAALADLLGHPDFYVAGWSGGGPVALACAALLPDRVRACLVAAGLAPLQEVGNEWRDWYTPEVLAEWDLVLEGDASRLDPLYAADEAAFSRMTRRGLLRFGTTERDRDVILASDDVGPPTARAIRRAFLHGYFGYLDDNVAQAADWGFRVGDIRVPVVIRHGDADHLDVRHGRWLAAKIPGARAEFPAGVGHVAIVHPFEDIVSLLVDAEREAARPRPAGP